MQRSARSYVTALTKQIARASRYGSHCDLAACISGDALIEKLVSAPTEARKIVMNTYARAWAKCEVKSPLIAPTKAKARWDAAIVSRLRTLAARYPDNADLAKAMGLSINQVSRARLRFVGKSRNAPATHNRYGTA
jgi:hypothetical protein